MAIPKSVPKRYTVHRYFVSGTGPQISAGSINGSRDPPRMIAMSCAAAPTGSLAQSEADPIFALIARHRAEQEAYGEALVAREHGVTANDRDEQLCHSCHELGWALANTTPTSLAGVAAVLRYVNEFEDRGEEWPGTDTIGSDGWHYQLRQTAARALETPLS